MSEHQSWTDQVTSIASRHALSGGGGRPAPRRQTSLARAWAFRALARFALCTAAALALGAAGCGPKQGGIPDRQIHLESELSQIPPSTDASTTLRRSRLLRALGMQNQALEELGAASEEARERLSWKDLANLWREVGDIHLEQGRPEQALAAFGKRLKSADALEETYQKATALVDTGYAFVLLGHVVQADETRQEAAALAGEELERDPLTLERLALIQQHLTSGFGEVTEARSKMAKAAAAHDSAGNAEGAARARVYDAHLAAIEGDPSALLTVEASVAQLADPGPLARLRRFQARAALNAHAYDRCEQRASESVTLADRRGLIEVAKFARVLLARCAGQTGHLDVAVRSADEAAGIAEEQLRDLSGELARHRQSYQAFQIYQLLLSLQVQQKSKIDVSEAFETSERARARAHLDAVVRHRVAAFADAMPVSSVLVQDKAAAEKRVKKLTRALLKDQKRRRLAEKHRKALWALDEIKIAIEQSNPLLAHIAPPEPADVDLVREKLLDDETMLLSYFMAGDQVLRFSIDRSDAALDVLPIAAEDLNRAAQRYRRKHLLRPTTNLGPLKKAGRSLYDHLLGSVTDRLKGKKRIVIIPHGALAQLPLESLVDPTGRFLVETHDVQYSLSATLAVALAKQRAESKRSESRLAFVGLGDPVYDWASFSSGSAEKAPVHATRGLELWNDASSAATSESSGGATLERLPGTAKELRNIARLFGRDHRLYLRAEASEETVKKGALGGARIVHFATHGLILPGYQVLALTLRPEAKEDGFLLNSEIAELKLDADLAVLSACRTGETRVSKGGAEPVAGLALSLRAAGAQRVVLSLWPVADDATADLMIRFYKPLTKKDPDYSHSLSEAKRAMIGQAKWAHPFFWAPFVLMGQ